MLRAAAMLAKIGVVVYMSNYTTLAQKIQDFNPDVEHQEALDYAYSIINHSNTAGLDYRLVTAIIATESNFNFDSVGSKGEIGLMQIRPEFHLNPVLTKEQKKRTLLNPFINISVGVRYLAKIRAKYKTLDNRYIEYFNRGINAKIKSYPYYERVMTNYDRF